MSTRPPDDEGPDSEEKPTQRITPRPGGTRARAAEGSEGEVVARRTPKPAPQPAVARQQRTPKPAVTQQEIAPKPASRPRPAARPASAPPRRPPQKSSSNDVVPLVLSGVIGALLLGLLAVFALSNSAAQNAAPTSISLGLPILPTPTQFVIDVGVPAPTTNPNSSDPPRIALEELKALYDDPAKRPLIVDVRGPQAYAEAHIQEAINVPGDAVQANLALLPKEKMIVLYCQ